MVAQANPAEQWVYWFSENWRGRMGWVQRLAPPTGSPRGKTPRPLSTRKALCTGCEGPVIRRTSVEETRLRLDCPERGGGGDVPGFLNHLSLRSCTPPFPLNSSCSTHRPKDNVSLGE